MTLLVDTCVWSPAFPRDDTQRQAEVLKLHKFLEDGSEPVVITGVILQELLQGFTGPRARRSIVDRFAALPMLVPDRDDHIEAAVLLNACRRSGVQLGTIDALLARLCIRYGLTLLITDRDFVHASAHCALKSWTTRTH